MSQKDEEVEENPRKDGMRIRNRNNELACMYHEVKKQKRNGAKKSYYYCHVY
jgi:hypothetical protein